MLIDKIISKSQKDFDKVENAIITADVKYQILADRLRKIIEDVVTKLRILMKVSCLFTDEGVEVMRHFLGDTNTDFILTVCKKCSGTDILEDFKAISDTSAISRAIYNVEAYRSDGEENRPSLDTIELDILRITQVAHMIMDSKELVKYLEENAYTHDVMENKFLWCIETLRDLVLYNLKLTGKNQKEREESLKDSYRNSLIVAGNIKELEHELDQQLRELKQNHESRLGVMFDLEHQVQVLKDEYKEKFKKMVYESEKAMMKACNFSEERQVDLAVRVEEDTQQYEVLLAADLKEELDLRSRKSKIETQLASWLAKYDQDIGDKQTELERLESMYNEEQEQLEQLQADFEDQAEEYDFLMAEKEAEEQKLLEEMLYKFVRNRAARIIQRSWRAYRTRKINKKKKKGKKGSDKKGSSKNKDKKKDKATDYVKGIEKREKERQDSAKPKEKTLEQKFGEEVFKELKDDDPSNFEKHD